MISALNAGIRKSAIFGAADGLITFVGLLAGLVFTEPHAIFRASLSAGLAELVGMTAGKWLSEEGGRSSFLEALACGGATFFGCFIPALPYLVQPVGTRPLVFSLLLAMFVALVIAVARPARGGRAFVETYGVLAVAAGLCIAAGLL